MSRIVTDWVLELGDSKAGLEDLISTVNLYNTTIAKAAQTGKVGFTQIAQQQQQANQQMASAVQNQSAINKAVDAGTAVITKAIDAEKKLGGATTETSEKAKAAIDQNIARQNKLTEAIDASAAAAQRSAAGGSQIQTAVPRSASPVPPATAIVGAVPSPAVAAVTEEFNRQIALAAEASKAAQAYLQGVTEAAAAAKLAAAAANEEAKGQKAVYDEDLAALKKLERAEVDLQATKDKASPGEQWIKANAALERNLALQAEYVTAVQADKAAVDDANKLAAAANNDLLQKISLQNQAKQLVKEAADAEKGLQAASKAAIAAANEEARATGLIGQAEAKLTALIERRKQAQTKPELQGINQEIAALNKEIDSYKKLGQTQATPTTGGFFSGLIGQLGIAAAGFFTLQKAYQFFTDGLKNAADLAGIKSGFTALAGSAEAGAAEFQFIDDKAKELGLDLITTAESYRLLYASAKEANLSGEQTKDIFSAITSEAKVLGLSNAKVESSLRAVSQMLGKGVVSSEELRRQLGEALPDATAQAAKALGVTTAQLDNMLRKGQIIASDFLPKFAAQITKTYGGATADAATQLQANLNRISNSYAKFSAGIVGFLAPAIAALANLVQGQQSQSDIADQAAAAFQRQRDSVHELIRTVPDLVKEIETLQGKTSLNATEQARLAKLIAEVGKAVPGAITAVDQYGKALGINKDAVNAFIIQNSALSKRLRDAAIRDNEKLLSDLEAQQKKIVDKLNNTAVVDGVARLQRPINVVGAGVSNSLIAPYDTQAESDKESLKLNSENEKVLTRIAAIRARINEISTGGKPIDPDPNGGAAQKLSLLLELRTKLAELDKKREAVTSGPVTAANPNGGGAAQILAYTAEMKRVQAEIDKLLGKEAAKTVDPRIAALKALQAAEKKLREDYNKSVLDELKDAGQARAAEQLRQDFNEYAEAERQIIALEKAYAKAGGRGANADGKLDAEQQQQINNLRLLAVQKYNEEIERIDREANQRILDLQADSDEKELAQLRAKYAEEIRVAEVSNQALGARIERAASVGNEVLVLSLAASKSVSDKLLAALKDAAAEQEKLLVRQQALNAIDTKQQLRTDSIEAGALPLAQVNDATADGTGAEQAGAAKRLSFIRGLYESLTTLEVDLEKKKQKALLQAQIDGNNERLAQYASDFTKEGIVIKAGLTDANAKLYNELNAIKEPEGRKFDLMKLLGVAPEDQDNVRAALQEAGSQIIFQINSFAQAQVDAANATAEATKQQLQDKRSDLDTEIALNKQGFASNVELRRAELEDAKAARDKALEDQKKALKAQQTIETVQQTISLISSASQIIKGFSAIPIIGLPLGIAAVTAMFGFFVAAKAKAAGATKLEKGGLHGGKSHREGGNKYLATDGSFLEIEEGEFTIRKSSTKKHRELIEALNVDDERTIQHLSLRYLLKGTGVRLSSEVPKRITHHKEVLFERSAAPNQDLREVKDLLSGIKHNTTPKAYSYETETHRVQVDGNYTRRIRKQ
jgi:tape measure domain-containing protein